MYVHNDKIRLVVVGLFRLPIYSAFCAHKYDKS